MYNGVHKKCPFLWHFNETENFLNRFLENTKIPNFMKIQPVGAEFFHAD
jgi:hypothetical protein